MEKNPNDAYQVGPTLGGKDQLKYGALGLSVEESRTFTTHNAAGEGEKERGRESEVSHFLLLCSPSASLLQVLIIINLFCFILNS